MSRIGRKPVPVPEAVTVEIAPGSTAVKGPKGELSQAYSQEMAVEQGEFDAAVADWAGKLASKSPVLMRLGHDAMYRQQDMAVDDALDYLRSQLSLTFSTEDIVEGVTAFFEKREPQWKGR